MSAKLFDFYAIGINSDKISYLPRTKESGPPLELKKTESEALSAEGIDVELGAVIVGAISSMIARKVLASKLILRN